MKNILEKYIKSINSIFETGETTEKVVADVETEISAAEAAINANNTADEEEVVAEEPTESSEEIAEEEIVEEEASNEAEDTPEDSPVSTVLSNLGKTDCAELKAALNRKYNTMIAVKSDISNEETLTRLTNYAKAWEFQQKENQAAMEEDVIYENKERAEAKTVDELVNAYQQFGKEYVEFYDKDYNDKVDIYEMFYDELINNYMNLTHLTRKEATELAIKNVEEFKNANYDFKNPPQNNTAESLLFTELMNRISTLEDLPNNENFDFEIDYNEAATHLFSMAQICDDKNSITKSEFNNANFAIKYNDCTLEEIMTEENCSRDAAEKILQAIKAYKRNANLFSSVI